MAFMELADNAADVSAQVELEQLDDDTYRVGDEGPGLDCDDASCLWCPKPRARTVE